MPAVPEAVGRERPDTVLVVASKLSTDQLLANLLGRALVRLRWQEGWATVHVSLIGEGRDWGWAARIYDPFVTAASDVAARRGASVPRVAIALLDEGEGVAVDGERFTSVLRRGGAVDPVIVTLPLEATSRT